MVNTCERKPIKKFTKMQIWEESSYFIMIKYDFSNETKRDIF